MIKDPLDYFRQWIPQRSKQLQQLETEAKTEQIPIIGPVVGQLLYLMARLHNARRIIELGTAIGYSTLYLAQACRHTGGKVFSYDLSPELVKRAKISMVEAGFEDVVQISCEEALKAMKQLEHPVDMIFMDIDKEYYLDALPICAKVLKPGGLLFVDNTGFKDTDSFNKAIYEDSLWDSVNLWCYLPSHSPEHDGLCLAIKQ